MKSKKQPAALDPSARLDLVTLLPAMAERKGWPAAKVGNFTKMLEDVLEPPPLHKVYPNEKLRTEGEAAATSIPRSLSDNPRGVVPGNPHEVIQKRAIARRFVGELYLSARRNTIVPASAGKGPHSYRVEAVPPFGWEWEKPFRRALDFFEKSVNARHKGVSEITSMLTTRNQDLEERGLGHIGDIVESNEADFTNRQIGEIVTRAWLSDDSALFTELATLSEAKARTRSDPKMPALTQGVELICIALNLCLALNRNPTRKELKAQCVKENLSVGSWNGALGDNHLTFLDCASAGRPSKQRDRPAR